MSSLVYSMVYMEKCKNAAFLYTATAIVINLRVLVTPAPPFSLVELSPFNHHLRTLPTYFAPLNLVSVVSSAV